MTKQRPVVVQLPNGAEYGVASPAVAAKKYPDGKVVRYQDGEIFEEPKPKAAAKSDEKKG